MRQVTALGGEFNRSTADFNETHNTQLSGEDAEDQNVIHILTAGASSERPKGVTSTACYVSNPAGPS